MQNLKCENEFDPDNEPVGETHFYMNCFTQRLILKQRKSQPRNSLFVQF